MLTTARSGPEPFLDHKEVRSGDRGFVGQKRPFIEWLATLSAHFSAIAVILIAIAVAIRSQGAIPGRTGDKQSQEHQLGGVIRVRTNQRTPQKPGLQRLETRAVTRAHSRCRIAGNRLLE
jgi:hypothetical protein